MKRSEKARQRRIQKPPDFDRFSPLLDPDPAGPERKTFTVKTKVWRYKGKGGWHFANLPKAESAEIRKSFAATRKRGWGSIPVSVRIGETDWDTSLFPDRKTNSYLFAIKASVREAEGISDSAVITVHISIRAPGKPAP